MTDLRPIQNYIPQHQGNFYTTLKLIQDQLQIKQVQNLNTVMFSKQSFNFILIGSFSAHFWTAWYFQTGEGIGLKLLDFRYV